MIRCNMAKECRFFAVHDNEAELRDYFTGLYCAGDFGNCARYKAAAELGKEMVSDEIFPNEEAFRSLFSWAVLRPGTQSMPTNHKIGVA